MTAWTEDRVAGLRSMWAKGMSGGVIADMLGGITRNAVIGKAFRLGLAKRGTTDSRRSSRAATAERKRRQTEGRSMPPPSQRSRIKLPARVRDMDPAQPSLIRDAKLDVPRVAFADLEPHHCRWPIGDPTQGFCGCPKHPGTPYCRAHGERAYGVRVDMIPGAVAGTIKHDNATHATHAAVAEFVEAVA